MHVIIIGCGRVGAYAAAAFAREGHSVVVIDKEPKAFRRLPKNFTGTRIVGVAYDRETLEKAGIARADAVVSVTNGDNTNIVAARIAKETFRVPIVISRIYDPQRAEIYRRFGISTFAPTVWGGTKVYEMVTSGTLNREITFGDGEVQLIPVSVPEHFIGKQIDALYSPGEINVAVIERMGKAIVPVSGTKFEERDLAHVLVHNTAVEKFQKMMGLK